MKIFIFLKNAVSATPTAGCMKIRVLEMKWREIKTKEKLLELEKEEIARELQAEKEKLKPLLEESINPTASD